MILDKGVLRDKIKPKLITGAFGLAKLLETIFGKAYQTISIAVKLIRLSLTL